jgi:hypothetical protein
MPVGELANNALAAADAAASIGFPVVVKVADERVVHKTDRRLVRAGLQSAPEVIEAVRAFGTELCRDDVPVLGQLAGDVPEIAELDLNPVMATPRGAVLVDVKVRLAEGYPVSYGLPRQLRMH